MKLNCKLLAIIIAIALMFFIVFEVCEYDHDCSGEHCAICAIIHIVGDLLKSATFFAVVTFAMIFCNSAFCRLHAVFAYDSTNNMVLLKTKQTA